MTFELYIDASDALKADPVLYAEVEATVRTMLAEKSGTIGKRGGGGGGGDKAE